MSTEDGLTRNDWLQCSDPGPMLDFLRGKASERKFRLFACACYRHHWELMTERRDRHVIKLAELYADGAIGGWKLAQAFMKAHWGLNGEGIRALQWWDEPYVIATRAAELTRRPSAEGAATQADLVRCILPFPPHIETGAAWIASQSSVGVATGIYGTRRFDRLPILADALEETGCTDDNVLTHCRSSQFHALGCWVVDLLLGKQ